MKWRIYYDDGTTYSDEDGLVEDAPGLGVQAITVMHPENGRYIFALYDYYTYRYDGEWQGEWDGNDIFGLWDYLQQPGFKKVVFGRGLPNKQYYDIIHRANTDPDFPMRTGNHPTENHKFQIG